MDYDRNVRRVLATELWQRGCWKRSLEQPAGRYIVKTQERKCPKMPKRLKRIE